MLMLVRSRITDQTGIAGLTMGPCSHVDQLEGVAVAIGGADWEVLQGAALQADSGSIDQLLQIEEVWWP